MARVILPVFPRLAASLLCALLSVAGASAQEGQEAEIAAIREALTRTQPGMLIESIERVADTGLYEVVLHNGQRLYASPDARYFIPGEIYEVRGEGMVNLSEERRSDWRAAKMAALEEEDMIIYEAKGERKATLTVFTDVDCPYCRQLHGEVPELNARGITVRYLAFPRTGLGTETHRKMISTWCADDPRSVLTSAKRGGTVAEVDCSNPIAEQYELGRAVGVTGTPALVFEDGSLVPGYVPADTLSEYLLGPAN